MSSTVLLHTSVWTGSSLWVCVNTRSGAANQQTDRRDTGENLIEDTLKWKTSTRSFHLYFYIFFPLLGKRVAMIFRHLLFWYTGMMKASFILTLLPWLSDVQKRFNIFICLIALWGNSFNSGEQTCGEQSGGVLHIHPWPTHLNPSLLPPEFSG